MNRNSRIHELKGRAGELDSSVKEMQEQKETYEVRGMVAEAKKVAVQADECYNEWLGCTAELANLAKNMKDDR